jgi:hypothetical protein
MYTANHTSTVHLSVCFADSLLYLPQMPFPLHFVCANGAAAVFSFLLSLPPAAQNRKSQRESQEPAMYKSSIKGKT